MKRAAPKRKPRTIWVAVDPSGMPGPWTARYFRRDCKTSLINDWLGPDLYEKYGRSYQIVKATLTLSGGKGKGK